MMVRCQEKVFANIAKLQTDQREYGQRQSTQMDADRICKRSEEKLTAALNYIQSKKKEPEKSQKFRRAQADYNQVSTGKSTLKGLLRNKFRFAQILSS